MSSQSKIKIEKIRSDDIDVNYAFNYVRYSSTENSNIESRIDSILDPPTVDSMYISLNTRINFSKNFRTVENGSADNLLNSQLLNSLQELSNLTGNSQRFNLFNKLKKNTNLQIFSKDIKSSEDINIVNQFLGLNPAASNNYIQYLVNSNGVIINNDVKENILFQNRNNSFFTNNIESLIGNYDKIYKNTFSEKEDKDLKSIFSGFIPFNKRSIYIGEQLTETSTTFIGVFVDKFIKVDNEYVKIASTYKKSNKINDTSAANETFDIKDAYVKYGKTYRYAIFPVYLVDIPSFEDFHTYSQYIVCNYPYITEDILCKEFVRPDPPQAMFFNYYNSKKEMHIEWQHSISPQGDVKGYQIFKRHSLEEPFTLLKQIEFHSKLDNYERNPNIPDSDIFDSNEIPINYFVDKSFDTSKINIYTICSIDAHGYVSNYSVQIGVVYDFVEAKCIIDTISGQGAPLNYPNLLIPRKTRFIDNEDKLVAITPIKKDFKKATLYVAPEFKNVNDIVESEKTILNDKYKFNILRIDNFKLASHIININIQ